MTRHSRNATANPCYTYHERVKDSKESGYGSKTSRLSKDAVRPSDCCGLTLQPAKEPVVTPEGYLYERSSIIEYMVHEKEAIALRLKQWKKRKQQLQEAAKLNEAKEKKAEAERFAACERHVVSSASSTSSKVKADAPRSANANSFWVPGIAKKPAESEQLPPRPEEVVRCPLSGKPLKLKDLITVHFKQVKRHGDETAASSVICLENGDYVCALTGDVLNNSQQLAVLQPSGAVVLQSAAEKILRPNKSSEETVMDPIAGKPLESIISLKRGGSGFAASTDLSQIQATLRQPVLSIA